MLVVATFAFNQLLLARRGNDLLGAAAEFQEVWTTGADNELGLEQKLSSPFSTTLPASVTRGGSNSDIDRFSIGSAKRNAFLPNL
jgi:hypothetical protein